MLAGARRYARAHGGGSRRAAGRRAHRDDRGACAPCPPHEVALMLQATGLGLSAGGRELIGALDLARRARSTDRKSTRLNSSHTVISYAVFCLKKKTRTLQ